MAKWLQRLSKSTFLWRLLLVSYRAYVSLDVKYPIMIAFAWNDLGTGFAVGDKRIKSISPRVGSETI